MAPIAELECSVEYTWCPVIAARKAIVAVGASRTSPTRITSGSWRISERMPLAKSSLTESATAVCRTSGIGYSTGSSRVMMFTPSRLMWFKIEYSVVVLPLPVGPVSRIIPSGRAIISCSCSR